MSLTTASAGGGFSAGGAGGGGLAMAHHADAVARAAPPPQHEAHHSAFGSAAAPPSAAALGADQLDKDQSLSMKQVRNLSHLPIVAVDLFGSEPQIARFPPKSNQETPQRPSPSGTLRALTLNSSEASRKALRKWLTKGKGFESVRSTTLSKDEGIEVVRPEQLLGVRRLNDVPSHIRESYPTVDDDSPAPSEESGSVGVVVANGTMDGRTPTGDDYDRVVFRVRLHESRKAVTMLPDEAVGLLLSQAKFKVSRDTKSEDDEEEVMEYPIAVALPTWACNDSSVEALLEAEGGNAVLFQRNVAACAGSLLPGPEGSPNAFLNRLGKVQAKKQKEFQQQHPDGSGEFRDDVLVVIVGLTSCGIECTAILVSELQQTCPSCLFGNFKVLTNVSSLNKEPVSLLGECIEKLQSKLAKVAPEEDIPVAFVTHGTVSEQKDVKSALEASKLGSWEKVPAFSSNPDCVAVGTAVLGAVSHGRLLTPLEGATKKNMTQRAIRIQNVSPTAVGIRMNYHGGASKRWNPVKVLFDFDRRVPAGPHPLELNAAECAAHRNVPEQANDDILEASRQYEGSKGIPKREEAALDFRLQIMQKWTRDGEWIPVGDPMSPLSKRDDEDDEKHHACESAVLELSLIASGIITASLVGDGKSVVQATKSARNSKLRYYGGVLLAIAFFGGFLIKSYWEERVFERDTERLLAYYKHVIPGSLQDGDQQNARYLVWKYRGKKAKLWKRLELKYGAPVLHADEWETDEPDEEEVVENLDEDPVAEEPAGNEDGEGHEGEQDL